MNNNYVIYRHLKPNNEVFYIGIGDNKRPYWKHSRSDFWNKIVNKHGYKVEIILDNLTWQEACDLEISLIWLYGRRDKGLGTLCNLTDGGDGSLGTIVSQETRNLLSSQRKGRIVSQETKDKTRNTLSGTKRPQEVKDKLKESRLKLYASGYINPNAKQVINTITGEIYPNATMLAKLIGVGQSTLNQKLNNIKKNNTNYKYLK